jgi:alpha-glucosidase
VIRKPGFRLALLVPVTALIPAIGRAGNDPVTISEGADLIRVTVLAPDVVRVRHGPGGRFENDGNPEFVIVNPDAGWQACPFTASRTADRTVIATGSLILDFKGHPPSLTVTDRQNRPVFSQDPADFSRPTAALSLAPGEHIYGFGDKRGPLDHRGRTVDLWNKDAFGSEGDDSYKNAPFYMSSRGYGLFLHNWWRTLFDVGATVPDRIRMTSTGGELDYYVFYGPSLKRIISLYTGLTGRPALQPLWFFGYHQGKASYKTPEEGLTVAREMRTRRLPCDAIYYDDTGPSVTAEGFVRELRDRYHIRLTLGLGNPQVITGSHNDLALQGINGLIAGSDGTATHYFTEETEDDIANVDFFSAPASDLFFDLVIRPALEHGGEIGMLDFGELEYVPDPTRAWFPGIRRTVAEMHNMYGLVYTEGQIVRAARFSGGLKRPGRLTGMLRCGTAGSQRAGWTTTGDSLPTYSNFRAHLRGLLSLTMCGFSNVGYDIGGWDAKGPDDLYARWFLAGMFNPFAWAHGQGDHEPYAHGAKVEKICRAALERRYRLLPYLYDMNEPVKSR